MISTNLFEITFQIVNFLILLWLLNKLLFKSLVSYLDKRQDIIKSDLELAKSNKLESEKIIEKQNESLQQALLEAKSIREKAEDSSKKERELSLEKTKEEAARILENTKKEIKLDFQRSKNDLISQVGNITIELTKKVLKKEVSKETHQELLNSYIETIK
ncbi:F0F1 ATP synthase subunit B [bacterium]|nr:F0F1 ATP synthase subunit B [bacterium]